MHVHARHMLFAAATSLTALLGAAAHAADAPDAHVGGNWAMTVQSAMGTTTPSIVLKQDGKKLTGTYKGRMGEAPLTGTVSGSHVELDIPMHVMGQDMLLTYKGVVTGETMAGETQMGTMGKGAFTGKHLP